MYQRTHRMPTRVTALILLLALLMSTPVWAATTAPKQPSVYAASAVVMDYQTGELLYAKNADTMRVPASMTKVMTAYIIFEELEAGRLTLDTQVPISAENARKSRDGSNYPASVPLPSGGTVSVDMLLRLILIPSASASCIVMAEYISGSESAFVQRMNETAKRLGMTAEYKNCHGAHVHYLTARSQAMLVREFIQRFPQVLNYTKLTGVTFNGKWYPNTNKLLTDQAYEYEGCDGFKTGTITAAGYCLSATAVRNGRRIITVVMKSTNERTRHTDSTALLDYGFDYLDYHSPYDDMTYHWAWYEVAQLKDLGVELHPSGSNYLPNQGTTRAEFTAMLYTALEKSNALPKAQAGTAVPTFNDIQGHWAQSYIQKAAQLGLVAGVSSTSFAPDRPITRQEMMVLMDRFLNLPDKSGLGFKDDSAIADWALASAARATAAGLFQGTDGYLMPTIVASRAESATVINRVLALAA